MFLPCESPPRQEADDRSPADSRGPHPQVVDVAGIQIGFILVAYSSSSRPCFPCLAASSTLLPKRHGRIRPRPRFVAMTSVKGQDPCVLAVEAQPFGQGDRQGMEPDSAGTAGQAARKMRRHLQSISAGCRFVRQSLSNQGFDLLPAVPAATRRSISTIGMRGVFPTKSHVFASQRLSKRSSVRRVICGTGRHPKPGRQ